jgi:hypothetical protein
MLPFGDYNPALTKAIRALASDSKNVRFISHAEDEMDKDGFDHTEVLMCLRKGGAHGPEYQSGELRANVVHSGFHMRVAVGGLGNHAQDWTQLRSVKVVTVMRIK